MSDHPPTRTIPCVCDNPYQDKLYGRGNRLFNHAPSKQTKPNRYRCTVCKAEREVAK